MPDSLPVSCPPDDYCRKQHAPLLWMLKTVSALLVFVVAGMAYQVTWGDKTAQVRSDLGVYHATVEERDRSYKDSFGRIEAQMAVNKADVQSQIDRRFGQMESRLDKIADAVSAKKP